jgi:hypothetical protein
LCFGKFLNAVKRPPIVADFLLSITNRAIAPRYRTSHRHFIQGITLTLSRAARTSLQSIVAQA